MDEVLETLKEKALIGNRQDKDQFVQALRRLDLAVYSENDGLLYVHDDEQANAAFEAGHRVTLRLEQNDLILIEELVETDNRIATGTFLAAVISTSQEAGFIGGLMVLDLFNGEIMAGKENYNSFKIDPINKITVLRRNGKPVR